MITKSREKLEEPYRNKRLSPLRAIKLFCKLHCCVGDMESWKNCTITDCLLYRYRLGKGNRALNKKSISTQHIEGKQEPSSDRQEKLL